MVWRYPANCGGKETGKAVLCGGGGEAAGAAKEKSELAVSGRAVE